MVVVVARTQSSTLCKPVIEVLHEGPFECTRFGCGPFKVYTHSVSLGFLKVIVAALYFAEFRLLLPWNAE